MEFDGELLDAFIGSCLEQLGDIEQRILSLEQGASADLVGGIFRAAHSLKADAAAMGFDRISLLAHQAEDLLHLVRSGRLTVSRPLIEALLATFDCLRGMVVQPLQSADVDVTVSLMRMGQVLASALSAAPRDIASPSCAGIETDTDGVGGMPAAEAGTDQRIAQLLVPASKLDALVDQIGELAGIQARLGALAKTQCDVAVASEDLERLVTELRNQIMALRMVPLKPVFAKFRRLVRDVAARTGKQVVFRVTGEGTELDKAAIEHLHGLLAHVLRNAVDHGVEAPEERVRAGKTPEGTLWLEARQIGGEVEIVIRDDGRGIDGAQLRQRAVARGFLAADAELSEQSLLELVFLPGLSTAEAVSTDSGRGVGMDAVRQGVLAMRGSVALASTVGQGTTVRVRIPLSLAMLDSLLVQAGGDLFFVQVASIEECLEVRRDAVRLRDGRGTLGVRGEVLPLVCLCALWGMSAPRAALASVLVVRSGDDRFGIVVDAIVGHRQIVLKKMSRAVGRLDGILGSAITEDGTLALVLDIPAIARHCFDQERFRA